MGVKLLFNNHKMGLLVVYTFNVSLQHSYVTKNISTYFLIIQDYKSSLPFISSPELFSQNWKYIYSNKGFQFKF